MKKFLKVLIIIVLLAAVVLPLAFLAKPLPKEEPSTYTPVLKEGRENLRPNVEGKWTYSVPSDNDKAAHIRLACEMYKKASENDQLVKNRAQEVRSVTTTMGIPVDGYRYCVKRDDEYLFIEYSFVNNSTYSLILSGNKESTRFAKRQYVNASMSKLEEELTLDPTMTEKDGYNTYNANWETAKKSQLDVPVYYAGQPLSGEMTEQKISVETVSDAKVSYNKEGGYYELEMTLDCSNPLTTAITLPRVRAGANSKDAAYTSIKETIQIWDNGYYKSFISIDEWSGNMGIILLSSVIDFRTLFYYDEESVKFENYQYAAEMVAKYKK